MLHHLSHARGRVCVSSTYFRHLQQLLDLGAAVQVHG
jgi:hypothetical protein